MWVDGVGWSWCDPGASLLRKHRSPRLRGTSLEGAEKMGSPQRFISLLPVRLQWCVRRCY